MDDELVIAGWDLCSKACAEDLNRTNNMRIRPGQFVEACRPDGTYRITEVLDPNLTEKEIKRWGEAPRPLGSHCPVCGELLPGEAGSNRTFIRALKGGG